MEEKILHILLTYFGEPFNPFNNEVTIDEVYNSEQIKTACDLIMKIVEGKNMKHFLWNYLAIVVALLVNFLILAQWSVQESRYNSMRYSINEIERKVNEQYSELRKDINNLSNLTKEYEYRMLLIDECLLYGNNK